MKWNKENLYEHAKKIILNWHQFHSNFKCAAIAAAALYQAQFVHGCSHSMDDISSITSISTFTLRKCIGEMARGNSIASNKRKYSDTDNMG